MASESRRSQMLRGVLDLCLLAVVVDEPAYGYEMTRRLRERGLSTVGEGSIYPLLGRLERDGLVATHRAASDGGPPRKYYRASTSGRRALAEGVRAWRDVRGEVDSVLAIDRSGGGVMTAFIEECRQEWKRLGVPDSMAEEMAAELEADLAEARGRRRLGRRDARRERSAPLRRQLGKGTRPRRRASRRRSAGQTVALGRRPSFCAPRLRRRARALRGVGTSRRRFTSVRLQPQTVGAGRGPEPRRVEGVPRQADRLRVGPQGPAVPATAAATQSSSPSSRYAARCPGAAQRRTPPRDAAAAPG